MLKKRFRMCHPQIYYFGILIFFLFELKRTENQPADLGNAHHLPLSYLDLSLGGEKRTSLKQIIISQDIRTTEKTTQRHFYTHEG